MRTLDLLRLILETRGRRKARVGLTAVGVVIGTAAVVVLVSLAAGLQRNATEQLRGISALTRAAGHPGATLPTFGGGGGAGGAARPGWPGGRSGVDHRSIAGRFRRPARRQRGLSPRYGDGRHVDQVPGDGE